MQYIRPLFSSQASKLLRFQQTKAFSSSATKKQQFRKCQTSIVVFSLSWFASRSQGQEAENKLKERDELIKKVDLLFQGNKHREICNLLSSYKDSDDVELLWRLVRAEYNLAQERTTEESEKQSLITSGYDTIQRSLTLDPGHWANHKWMSIMLDAYSMYNGIRARIIQLENVKHHMQKAIQLNPNDATTLYMLGIWCFEIANMPWYQRKIAATIFAAPPESSFEEALEYFEAAEKTEPRFYSLNLLMLGKTYLKLKNLEEAKKFLKLAAEYPPTTDDDIRANKEAAELLKHHKLES